MQAPLRAIAEDEGGLAVTAALATPPAAPSRPLAGEAAAGSGSAASALETRFTVVVGSGQDEGLPAMVDVKQVAHRFLLVPSNVVDGVSGTLNDGDATRLLAALRAKSTLSQKEFNNLLLALADIFCTNSEPEYRQFVLFWAAIYRLQSAVEIDPHLLAPAVLSFAKARGGSTLMLQVLLLDSTACKLFDRHTLYCAGHTGHRKPCG
jgi:hypothetical protein